MVAYNGYGGHVSDQEIQTERLIKAINDLTAEVVETRKHREKLLAKATKAEPKVEHSPRPMPKLYIERAVMDLQTALDHPATGIWTKADEVALANQGLTHGIIRR